MIVVSGLLAALAVALSAFGAHGLKAVLTPQMLAVWNTGAHYHLIHAVALAALALAHRAGLSGTVLPWRILLAGTVIFSGSLYALSSTGIRWLGAVAPVGGTLLVVGWCVLAFSVRNKAPE